MMPYSWASCEVRKQSRSMSFATCSVGRRAGHGLRYAQVVDVALAEAAIVVDDRDVVPRRQAQPNVDVAVVEASLREVSSVS